MNKQIFRLIDPTVSASHRESMSKCLLLALLRSDWSSFYRLHNTRSDLKLITHLYCKKNWFWLFMTSTKIYGTNSKWVRQSAPHALVFPPAHTANPTYE